MTRLPFALVAFLATSPLARAQEATRTVPGPADSLEAVFQVAPVEVDGVALFEVRGVSALPAEERAAAIAARIRARAEDRNFAPESLSTLEVEGGIQIMAGSHLVLMVADADARLEGVVPRDLARVYVPRIQRAIEEYRKARTRTALVESATEALLATAAFAAGLVFILWLFRRTSAWLQARYRLRVQKLEAKSYALVRGERIWAALNFLMGAGRILVLILAGFVYLHFVLGLFPWTRGLAHRLGSLLFRPLAIMGRAVAAGIPDLIFLAVLFVVVRYVLSLVHLFFDGVGRGSVTLKGFEPEWAQPTYRIARAAIVAFGLVVAYPYIPGSASGAFKGVSLFLGVIFSLGSSSAISNIIAGYTMTYRRAFRVGDRVAIGEVTGDVVEVRLQVTHLHTIKNEEVIVPNSAILNGNVVNYSTLARKKRLILHTTVGIGYETPWRQVEAMLLEAAARTPGLLREPLPFIHQTALGDFCITYELNVYSDDAQAMTTQYTDLHRSILDVFNEYAVQIMTPAYRGDPEQPKIVPRAYWYTAPAVPEPRRPEENDPGRPK